MEAHAGAKTEAEDGMDTVRSWLAAGLIAATFGIGGGALAATVQVKAGDGTPDAGGCGTRANPCDTIQAGVDNAEPGDVVNVGKGDYAENVAVATPEITLRGAGTLIGAPDLCAPTSGHIDTCLGIPSDVSCDSRWTIDDDFIPHARSCQWTGAECRLCPPEICPALCEGKIPRRSASKPTASRSRSSAWSGRATSGSASRAARAASCWTG
jgi:hypothetical protein